MELRNNIHRDQAQSPIGIVDEVVEPLDRRTAEEVPPLSRRAGLWGRRASTGEARLYLVEPLDSTGYRGWPSIVCVFPLSIPSIRT